MDIKKNLLQIYEVYIKNFGVVFLSTLVVGVLSCLSLGIAAGPLVAGLVVLITKLIKGEKVGVKEVFAHFDMFIPALIVVILTCVVSFLISIIGVIPLIGWIVSAVTLPVLSMVFILSIAFIVDQNMNPTAAVRRSVESFMTEPLMVGVYSLIIGVLAGLGAFLFFFPVILTLPIGVIGAVIAYQELSVKKSGSLKIEKKVAQLGALSIVGLLLVGMIFYFVLGLRPSVPGLGFLGGPKQSMSDKLTSKILSSITGEKIKIDGEGDSATFTVDGQSMTFGNKLPKNFPKDIPVYPGTTVESYIGGSDGKADGMATTLTTKDSSEKVVDFYTDRLKDKGWTMETSVFGNMTIIEMEKPNGYKGSVTIAKPSDSESKTAIMISLSYD